MGSEDRSLNQEASILELYKDEFSRSGGKAVRVGKIFIAKLSNKVLRAIIFIFNICLCCLNITCCCWVFDCMRKNYISEDEKGRFIRLANRALKPYEKENLLEEKTLKNLFSKAFGSLSLKELGQDLLSDKWKIMGFQTNDPRRDFRGGGLMGLSNIIDFMESRPALYEEMLAKTRINKWLFACNSIRVTSFLRRFFDFDSIANNTGIPIQDNRSRNKTKNLCLFLSQDHSGLLLQNSQQSNEQAYKTLHHILLSEIFTCWLNKLESKPDMTIVEMHDTEVEAESRFAKLLELRVYRSIDHFSSALAKSRGSTVGQRTLERVKKISH
jgi:hypothetical protein